uniref:Uncharacterized protein n=1 Tax=Anguilla anguilla TaxID=7936 RepID=A0A0E9Q789_ANGAN
MGAKSLGNETSSTASSGSTLLTGRNAKMVRLKLSVCLLKAKI